MALIVLDHDDGDWLAHDSLFRLLTVQLIGSVIVNVLPCVKFRGDRHGSAEPPHQRADVRQPDALPGLVLGSGAAEQVKDPLMVLGIDAAAVVGDLENRKAELGPAAHRDVAGNARLEIFQRVVDQIGENLLQRKTVADDVRQRFDPDLRLGFRGLMRHGGDDALDQFAGIDPHRLEFAPALAGEVEDGADQPVHLADRRFDEPERLGEILRQLLVGSVEHRLGGIGGVVRAPAARGRRPRQVPRSA